MAKAMRYFHGTTERETAKAVLVSYTYHVDTLTLHEHKATAWLPKSQIEVYHHFEETDGSTIWRVPAWLMNKNHLPNITKAIADEVIRSAKGRAA